METTTKYIDIDVIVNEEHYFIFEFIFREEKFNVLRIKHKNNASLSSYRGNSGILINFVPLKVQSLNWSCKEELLVFKELFEKNFNIFAKIKPNTAEKSLGKIIDLIMQEEYLEKLIECREYPND